MLETDEQLALHEKLSESRADRIQLWSQLAEYVDAIRMQFTELHESECRLSDVESYLAQERDEYMKVTLSLPLIRDELASEHRLCTSEFALAQDEQRRVEDLELQAEVQEGVLTGLVWRLNFANICATEFESETKQCIQEAAESSQQLSRVQHALMAERTECSQEILSLHESLNRVNAQKLQLYQKRIGDLEQEVLSVKSRTVMLPAECNALEAALATESEQCKQALAYADMWDRQESTENYRTIHELENQIHTSFSQAEHFQEEKEQAMREIEGLYKQQRGLQEALSAERVLFVKERFETDEAVTSSREQCFAMQEELAVAKRVVDAAQSNSQEHFRVNELEHELNASKDLGRSCMEERDEFVQEISQRETEIRRLQSEIASRSLTSHSIVASSVIAGKAISAHKEDVSIDSRSIVASPSMVGNTVAAESSSASTVGKQSSSISIKQKPTSEELANKTSLVKKQTERPSRSDDWLSKAQAKLNRQDSIISSTANKKTSLIKEQTERPSRSDDWLSKAQATLNRQDSIISSTANETSLVKEQTERPSRSDDWLSKAQATLNRQRQKLHDLEEEIDVDQQRTASKEGSGDNGQGMPSSNALAKATTSASWDPLLGVKEATEKVDEELEKSKEGALEPPLRLERDAGDAEKKDAEEDDKGGDGEAAKKKKKKKDKKK